MGVYVSVVVWSFCHCLHNCNERGVVVTGMSLRKIEWYASGHCIFVVGCTILSICNLELLQLQNTLNCVGTDKIAT